MLKYVIADVTISEHHIQRVKVPVWELPILTAIHDRQEPVLVEEFLVDRPAPDAADEFRRLANRYKNVVQDDGSQGAPWVAAVFGQFQGADSRLARAIREATVEADGGLQIPTAPEGGEPFTGTGLGAGAGIGDLLGTGEQVSSVGG